MRWKIEKKYEVMHTNINCDLSNFQSDLLNVEIKRSIWHFYFDISILSIWLNRQSFWHFSNYQAFLYCISQKPINLETWNKHYKFCTSLTCSLYSFYTDQASVAGVSYGWKNIPIFRDFENEKYVLSGFINTEWKKFYPYNILLYVTKNIGYV